MHSFVDQCGRNVQLIKYPEKIISLVPSQTELLYYLGLNEEVKGITKFCVHPSSWYKHKIKIGGTKNIHIEKVRELQPDLIIANKEENNQQQIEILAKEFPVYTSNIIDLPSALEMMMQVGEICNKKAPAQFLINNIQQQFTFITPLISQKKVAYLIWQNPYMVAGGDTFIHSMLSIAGFKNVFSHSLRYPVVDLEEIKSAGCDYILLSSEPFPFKEKHQLALQQQLPGCQVLLVDGELFSWYGSRLLKSPAYFNQLIKVIKDNP